MYAALIAFLLIVQVLSHVKRPRHLHLLLLAPGARVVIYIIDLIEIQALVRSFARLASGNELKWQRWQRAGVFDKTAPSLPAPATVPAGPVASPTAPITDPVARRTLQG